MTRFVLWSRFGVCLLLPKVGFSVCLLSMWIYLLELHLLCFRYNFLESTLPLTHYFRFRFLILTFTTADLDAIDATLDEARIELEEKVLEMDLLDH